VRTLRSEYNRGFAAGLRQAIIVALGGKCSAKHCTVTNPVMLHIDHVHGGGTQHRRRVGSGGVYYREILKHVRTGRYRLHCANHDRASQHYKRTHGGVA
jgi:hypothetical protein